MRGASGSDVKACSNPTAKEKFNIETLQTVGLSTGHNAQTM